MTTEPQTAAPLSVEEVIAEFGKPRYSITDLQRAYAQGHEAATSAPSGLDAGLREAALALADATDDYLDTGRSPSTWATDRSRLWQAAKDVRALASSGEAAPTTAVALAERLLEGQRLQGGSSVYLGDSDDALIYARWLLGEDVGR